MTTIVRRRLTFSGEISENAYNEAQFYVRGNDIIEAAREIQRDVFAFVADTGDVVEVSESCPGQQRISAQVSGERVRRSAPEAFRTEATVLRTLLSDRQEGGADPGTGSVSAPRSTRATTSDRPTSGATGGSS